MTASLLTLGGEDLGTHLLCNPNFTCPLAFSVLLVLRGGHEKSQDVVGVRKEVVVVFSHQVMCDFAASRTGMPSFPVPHRLLEFAQVHVA